MSFETDELTRVGWNDHWAEWWATVATTPAGAEAVPARIRRVDRGEVEIVDPDGDSRARTSPADPERPQPDRPPITGDWAAVAESSPPASHQPDDDIDGAAGHEGLHRALTTLAPRRTELKRRDPSVALGSQVLAANIDIVFVVEPLDRPVNQRRIERALVLAHDSRADPVIVLTKADAVVDDDPLALATAASGGVPVFITSAETGPVSTSSTSSSTPARRSPCSASRGSGSRPWSIIWSVASSRPSATSGPATGGAVTRPSPAT